MVKEHPEVEAWRNGGPFPTFTEEAMGRFNVVGAGFVSPALADAITDLMADQGVEVITQSEADFINAWHRKHAPRRKYLTDAQFAQARAEYAASKRTP